MPDPNYTVRADEQKSPLNEPVEPCGLPTASVSCSSTLPPTTLRVALVSSNHCAKLMDHLVTSEPVLLELERTPEPKRSLALLDDVAAVDEIVAAYLQHQLMPRDAAGDARHLALATFHGCAILATWNCRHIANANKQEHIRRVNSSLGFATPVLTTPFELLEQLP